MLICRDAPTGPDVNQQQSCSMHTTYGSKYLTEIKPANLS